MNWPLVADWKCPTCGQNEGLEWGLIHAQCRCNVCHTQFRMRDKENTITMFPICQLKDEYKEPLRQVYLKYRLPIDEITDAMIDEFMPIATEKAG